MGCKDTPIRYTIIDREKIIGKFLVKDTSNSELKFPNNLNKEQKSLLIGATFIIEFYVHVESYIDVHKNPKTIHTAGIFG